MKKTILTLSIFFLFCLSVNATVANPKGEIKAIFSENFDAMTEGSENEPAADELAASSAVDSALTQTPGWAGRGLHQAGGALAVMHFVKKDWFGTDTVQGYIQTPQFDVRLDEGNFAVRFRARTASDKGARIHVEIYDPYTSNNIQAATAEIGAEWTAVQLEMCHPGYGNHLAYLQLASEGEDWLMDDFEIVQDCYTIMPPVVHFPRNVSYTSFTGRWNAVPLADSYLVSVFTTGEKDEREYILTDSATTEYTMVVNGTVKGKDYYYTVRTVGNGFTSDESEPRKVNVPLTSLETPATLEATDVTADGLRRDGRHRSAPWAISSACAGNMSPKRTRVLSFCMKILISSHLRTPANSRFTATLMTILPCRAGKLTTAFTKKECSVSTITGAYMRT